LSIFFLEYTLRGVGGVNAGARGDCQSPQIIQKNKKGFTTHAPGISLIENSPFRYADLLRNFSRKGDNYQSWQVSRSRTKKPPLHKILCNCDALDIGLISYYFS
jgi:hypothetical protein